MVRHLCILFAEFTDSIILQAIQHCENERIIYKLNLSLSER